MTITVLYFHKCRRQRLRDAFSTNLIIFGSHRIAQLVEALQQSYRDHQSTRVNYNYAMHALSYVAGIEGLAASALIKEAWNEGSLEPMTRSESPANTPTHPGTTCRH